MLLGIGYAQEMCGDKTMCNDVSMQGIQATAMLQVSPHPRHPRDLSALTNVQEIQQTRELEGSDVSTYAHTQEIKQSDVLDGPNVSMYALAPRSNHEDGADSRWEIPAAIQTEMIIGSEPERRLCYLKKNMWSQLLSSQPDMDDHRRELACYLKKSLWRKLEREVVPLSSERFGGPLYQRCAVVSSSGALLKNDYGCDIDAADVVFRVNDAPVTGFEKHVGSSENVRVMWNTGLMHGYSLNKSGVSYLLRGDPLSEELRSLPSKYPESRFYGWTIRMEEEVTDVLREIYSDRWLQPTSCNTVTTGCMAMLFAMSFCGVVEAFEFAPSLHAADAPYHYYGMHSAGENASANGLHAPWLIEHDLWARLTVNTSTDVFQTGHAVYEGFRDMDCEENTSQIPHISLSEFPVSAEG